MGVPPTPVILPDKMPDAWLDQVKNVVRAEKPKVWIILLGSSVLASIITSIFSCATAIRNIGAAQQLEQVKTQLELKKDVFRARSTTYSNLEKNLSAVSLRLHGLSSLIEIAYRSPRSSDTSKRIQEESNAAGRTVRDLITERRGASFLEPAFAGKLDQSIKDVTLALSAVEKDSYAASPKLESARALIEQAISELQVERAKELNGVH